MFHQELQLTADGSHTLFVPQLDEHYHSVNGAIQESQHVYINAGLRHCAKKEIRVLEFGFGTGLNALLTCIEADKNDLMIHYTTLEKYPLPEIIYSALNYSNIQARAYEAIFQQMHDCEWGRDVHITPHFIIHKVCTDFADINLNSRYNVVYYDAFAPEKQAGVWSQHIFNKIYEMMEEDGVLTTYCAKGSIRRMMQTSGFIVERIPGPPGKRQMLRAKKLKTKIPELLVFNF